MQDVIDGVRFEYERNALSGTSPILFLHGWGGGLSSFAGAYNAVGDWGMPAVNFAFPREVPGEWGIYDYAELVERFMRRAGISAPTVIGHSFGGRVAIILAARRLCDRLVLVDSAGMRPRLSLRKKLAVHRYRMSVKRGKPLDGMGSMDYNNTSGDGRRVFVRIVNSHLDGLLPYIDCRTLIVWGRADKDTPAYMARRLHRGIRGSRLCYLDGGHYAYADSHCGFLRLIKDFVSD